MRLLLLLLLLRRRRVRDMSGSEGGGGGIDGRTMARDISDTNLLFRLINDSSCFRFLDLDLPRGFAL